VSNPVPQFDPVQLRAILAGNEAALTRWFEAEADSLYTFVFHRVGKDPWLASDVVHSTFSDALSRLAEYDAERGSMSTWLRILSRNIIRSTLRAQRSEVSLEAYWTQVDSRLHAIYADLDTTPIPGEVLERDETRELVSIAIANLPEDYRDVLTRKYIDECALTEIAEQCHTSVDAVKAKLRRARSAFRQTFLTLNAARS